MGFKEKFYGFKGYFALIKGNIEEAEKYLRIAYEAGTTKTAYVMSYGSILMRKQSFAESLEVFNRAKELCTEKEQNYIPMIESNIITCRYRLGELEGALEDVEKLFAENKISITYMLYAYMLMRAGRLDDALKINLEGYEYDEKDVGICDNLGLNYYFLGDKENAKRYFEEALAIKYNMVDSCYYLALIYIEESNLEKAYDLLEEAKEAPFSALTNVTREEINEKYAEVEALLKKEDF